MSSSASAVATAASGKSEGGSTDADQMTVQWPSTPLASLKRRMSARRASTFSLAVARPCFVCVAVARCDSPT